ncbi:hypothetical protein ACJJTC_009313 [Scirpophaga incertulas]
MLDLVLSSVKSVKVNIASPISKVDILHPPLGILLDFPMDRFLNHFASVYVDNNSGSLASTAFGPPEATDHQTLGSLSIELVTVQKVLKGLKRTLGTGPDLIPAVFIVDCAANLRRLLYYVGTRLTVVTLAERRVDGWRGHIGLHFS